MGLNGRQSVASTVCYYLLTLNFLIFTKGSCCSMFWFNYRCSEITFSFPILTPMPELCVSAHTEYRSRTIALNYIYILFCNSFTLQTRYGCCVLDVLKVTQVACRSWVLAQWSCMQPHRTPLASVRINDTVSILGIDSGTRWHPIQDFRQCQRLTLEKAST